MLFWAIGGTRLSLATESKDKVQPSRQSPLWQLDVRALGYIVSNVRYEPGRGSPTGWKVRYVCSPTEDTVVVTFVTREAPTGLPQRGHAEASLPFRLHALFIDAKDGKLRTNRQWPTASEWSWIAPGPRGKFVVITPDELVLYSPEVEPLRRLGLALSTEATKDQWGVGPSPPGGRYLIVGREVASDGARAAEAMVRRQLIDTETLQVIDTWTEEGMRAAAAWSITDDGTVLEGYEIGKHGGPFRRLCLPSLSQSYCGELQLISNGVVLSTSYGGRGLALIATGGELLLRQDFPDREVLHRWASSANGERLAIALEKLKGGSAVLDIGQASSLSRVIVYDIPARQWVYSLDGKKQGAKHISALALSPDGSLLAWIDQDGLLGLYRLPAAARRSAPDSAH